MVCLDCAKSFKFKMNMLCSGSTRCVHHKFYANLSIVKKSYKPNHSSLQILYPRNRILFLTSTRSLSLEGFYTSISTSTPVLTMQNLLLDLHNYSGLPWWTVIFLSTLAIRSIIIFPLAVHQNQVIARFANLNAELGRMAPELNKEVNIAVKMYGWNETTAKKVFRKNMKAYYQKFIIRDNCHPFKIILLALFQIPVWVCFSVSLRNLTTFGTDMHSRALSVLHDLKTEGTLWFSDLTLPDMFIIPVLLTAVNLLLIEVHTLRQMGKGSKLQRGMLYMMRLFVIMIGGAAALNPASVSFYWLCSSIFGLIQSILFMSPRFRRFLRIPRMTNESGTPFKDLALNFKKRFLS